MPSTSLKLEKEERWRVCWRLATMLQAARSRHQAAPDRLLLYLGMP